MLVQNKISELKEEDFPAGFEIPLCFRYQYATTVEISKEGSSSSTSSMTYITFDPFNDRAKVFKSDFTYNLPTNSGTLYMFN